MTSRRKRRIVSTLALALAASAVVAWAFWSTVGGGSAAAVSGSLAAATIGAAPSGLDAVTVTWTEQASLQPTSPDNSAITYSVERKLAGGAWAAVASGGCSGAKSHGTTSCVDAPPATGSYSYRVDATFRTWTATSDEAGPVSVTTTDSGPPTNAITLSGVTGGALKSGATVYYRGLAAGSFTLTNALTDSGSGPASSQTAALSGASTGWTHSPSLVLTPAGGPYVSNAFSWAASTTSSPSETVTGRDVAANTAATALTFTDDSTAPAGGSVDATGLVGTGARYSTSTGLNIAFDAGTEAGSGLATGAQLLRASAALSGGNCDPYDPYYQVGADDPVSPAAGSALHQHCYSYQYVVSDRVGNQRTYTSPDIKVDVTAPTAPASAYSGFTNTYWSGSTLYYRRDAGSGAFTLTASASDATSGIASYAFPSLGTGWTATPGALGVNTYSWSTSNPAAPAGTQNVTATNNASLTSAAGGFTMTSDITAPTGGSVGYTNGYYNSPSVSVSFARGGDVGGSGVLSTFGLLQRRQASLTAGGTCVGYGGFATLVPGGSDPTSPFVDTDVVSGTCYQYQYLASDNVGNQATYTSTNQAKVDLAPPTVSRATAAKATGTPTAVVRQGASYSIYAQVSDTTGVSTVTTAVSTFDTVATTTMETTGGPWTVGTQSYNYRSPAAPVLTANTGLTTGASYNFTVTATDLAGNTTGPTTQSATIETYSSVIAAESGLISYWRFNDGVIAGDEFTDTAGTVLSSHTGQVGATWAAVPSQARTGVISNANRLRKETGTGAAQYYASGAPAGANYLVKGDVQVVSRLVTDEIAVVGRQDVSGTGQTYYVARHMISSNRWELAKVVAGTSTLIGTAFFNQTLVAGTTYQMTLQMNGSAIALLVDGVSRITATDSAITAAGRGGVRLGSASSPAAVSDTAGLHLDNFRISSLGTTAADSKGTNNGTFFNGPWLNEAGALAGDTDRAARLDGVNEYVNVPDALSLDQGDGSVTLEAWVKRNNTAAMGAMAFFDKGNSAIEFAWEASSTVIVKSAVTYIGTWPTTISNTNWHHLVGTRTTTAANLYVDGVNVAGGTVTPQTLINTNLPLFLGAQGGISAFVGATIDEFAIYNGALSAATVLDHYKAGMGTG